MATAFLTLLGLFIWWVTSSPWYDVQIGLAYRPVYLLAAPVLLAIGFILYVKSGKIYDKYFVRVRQGKIVDKNTSGGGDYPLGWYIVIEGYTYANELRWYNQYVSAGSWQEFKRGDFVDFR